jgi:tetratricopeptide (TPR) repeat protein
MIRSPHFYRQRSLRRSLWLAPALLLALPLAACSNGDADDQSAAALALVEQGITQMTQGENEKAEKTFERALRLDDEQYLAHYNQGVIDQRANREKDAEKHYEDALELEPEHGASLYNLAILTESEDLDEAIELYRDAIKVQPSNAAAYMRLGFALNHLGRTAESEPMLAKGLELDPSMAKVEAPKYD